MPPPISPPATTAHPGPLRFGPFVLDAAEARLLQDGAPVALVGRPLQVLEVLAGNAGRLVGRDELLDTVWGHRHVTDSVLKVALNALRNALGDDARAPRYVETVPRRGFRFIAEVHPVGGVASPLRPAVALADPAAGAAAPPGNLPPARPDLVGRQADHEQLLQLMRDHRLVTLTGLGGMGKTRLALEVAAHDPPADGAWLVRLDVLPPAGDGPSARQAVLAAIAARLPVPPGAAANPQALGRALAPLSLRLLLDNAEHVAAPLAALLPELLGAAPGLRVLVTSQRALRLGQEQVMPLASLALPAPEVTHVAAEVPDPADYAAGRLLVERLRRLQPGWSPQASEWADVAHICRILEGVPLAIELAAARVPLLGLAGVRQRLAAPLALLTRSVSDSQARHRSLAAALEWTFGLLGEAERQALHQLAVFVGGFSLAACEDVLQDTAAADALDLLQDLQDRSLVVVDSAADGARLRLFDSVRQHALVALAAEGREAEARRRHAAWAERCALRLEALEGELPQLQFLPRAAAEIDNLRSALHFSLGPEGGPADWCTAARTTLALVMVWSRLGLFSEAMGWFDRLQTSPAAVPDEALQAQVARARGTLALYAQNIPVREALAGLQAAQQVLGDGGSRRRAYLARYAESVMHMRLANLPAQRRAMQAARALVEPHWGPLQTLQVDWAEMLLVRDEGHLQAFLDLCVRNGRELAEAGARAEAWVRWQAQGQAAFALCRLEESCEVLGRLVRDIAQAGCLHSQAAAVATAAVVHLRRGGGASELALAQQAVRLLQAQGMVWWMADALPWAAWHQGRHADALRLQAWADSLVARRQDRRGVMFAALREQFDAVSGAPALPADHDLDEARAVRLALGPGTPDQASASSA